MRGESLPRAEGALGSRQDNSHDLSVGEVEIGRASCRERV